MLYWLYFSWKALAEAPFGIYMDEIRMAFSNLAHFLTPSRFSYNVRFSVMMVITLCSIIFISSVLRLGRRRLL
jgi:hypothetical protein